MHRTKIWGYFFIHSLLLFPLLSFFLSFKALWCYNTCYKVAVKPQIMQIKTTFPQESVDWAQTGVFSSHLTRDLSYNWAQKLYNEKGIPSWSATWMRLEGMMTGTGLTQRASVAWSHLYEKTKMSDSEAEGRIMLAGVRAEGKFGAVDHKVWTFRHNRSKFWCQL